MKDHSTIEDDHQNEREAIVHREIEPIPVGIDSIVSSVDTDCSFLRVETGKEDNMKVHHRE